MIHQPCYEILVCTFHNLTMKDYVELKGTKMQSFLLFCKSAVMLL